MVEQMIEPCPFCGSMDVFCGASPHGICMLNGVCMNCCARGPVPKRAMGERPNDAHDAEALRLWNTRADHSVMAERVAELTEAGNALAENLWFGDEASRKTAEQAIARWRAALSPHPKARNE